MNDRILESKAKCKRNRDNWKARALRYHAAIQEFCIDRSWCDKRWKDSPAIKPLFDISKEVTGEAE